MKNHWQTILGEIKNETEAVFDGAVLEDLFLSTRREKVTYSISIGAGVRVVAGISRLVIRREVIVWIQKLNDQDDLDFKADFANDISKLIINIEKNPQINSLSTALPISYDSDEGIIKKPLDPNIGFSTQIKFLTEFVERFEEDCREKNKEKIAAKTKEYRQKNKDKISAQRREAYRKKKLQKEE